MKPVQGLLAALALAGCGAAEPPGATAGGGARPLVEASVHGAWRIVAVNDRPARSSRDGEGPTLILRTGSYEGNTGCNGFSGTSLVQAERLFAGPALATQQGCGELTGQEEAVFAVLGSGPRLVPSGPDRLRLEGAAGRLLLQRSGQAAPGEAPADPPMLLAGSRWIIVAANGQWVGTTRAATPVLQFEADEWSLALACGKVAGRWRQQGGTPLLDSAVVPDACAGDVTAAAMRQMLAVPLGHAVGDNRELVLAGGGSFLAGRFDHDFARDDRQLLVGKWLVTAIDGRPPAKSPVPPNIIFGRASYAVWDGCNHREGLQLTYSRQLFTHDSGLSTLAACSPEQVSRRVPALLGSQPRIARTSGGLALVSRAGRLDLQRLSGRLFGGQGRTGLSAGMTVDLAGSGGTARLVLAGGRRFSLALPCGRLEGDWRPGQPARFSLDPPERSAPACPTGRGSLVWQMQRMFQGDVQAVVDGNGERALLLNQDRILTGRVVRR